jgi:hypothetical protein
VAGSLDDRRFCPCGYLAGLARHQAELVAQGMNTLREFPRFWALFVVFVIFVIVGLTPRSRFWHLSFDETELLVCTPWGGFWLAHEAFDTVNRGRFTGILIFRRIPGEQIYRDVFKHELRRQYL